MDEDVFMDKIRNINKNLFIYDCTAKGNTIKSGSSEQKRNTLMNKLFLNTFVICQYLFTFLLTQ